MYKKENTLLIIFLISTVIGLYLLYSEFFNWAESGEILKYMVRLPFGLWLLFLSIYNYDYPYNYGVIIRVIGLIIGLILLLPPSIIYTFIR